MSAGEVVAGVEADEAEATVGAGEVVAGVEADGTEATVGAEEVVAEGTVTGTATRAVGAIEGRARPGRDGAVEGAW